MERLDYQLSGGLDREQIKQIIEDAYWLVEAVGVEVKPEALRQPLAGQCGVRVTGQRVCVDANVAQACWQAAEPTDVAATASFVISNGGNTSMLLDLRTGEARPPMVADLIEMCKLCDAFGLAGYAPIQPQDVPVGMQEVAANYYARLHARALGGGVMTSRSSAEYMYEMSQVAGPPFRVEYYAASPLAFDRTGLDTVFGFRGRGVPIAVGVYLLAGMSAPMSLAAAWTQWLAENIAAVVLLSFACEGDHIQWMADGGAHASDFRYSNMRAGAPEEILFRLAGIQLMRHLGVEARGTVSVMGKQADARSAAERLAGLMAFALADVHVFYGAGLIGFDSIFSGAQLVMDLELLAYVERFMRGMIWDGSEVCRAALRRAAPDTRYLIDELTIQRSRPETWNSKLFEYSLYEQWRSEGGWSTSQRMCDIAEGRIAGHQFELAPEKRRALDAIWERAKTEMT